MTMLMKHCWLSRQTSPSKLKTKSKEYLLGEQMCMLARVGNQAQRSKRVRWEGRHPGEDRRVLKLRTDPESKPKESTLRPLRFKLWRVSTH